MGPSLNTAEAAETRIRAVLRKALEKLYPFATVQLADVEGVEQDRLVLRVTARCNQRCPFCQAELSISEDDPPLHALVRAADRMAAALPACQIILTGGEPTLRTDITELCRYIVSIKGVSILEMQTNAVRLGRHVDRFAWPSSTKLRFLVAFHGFTSEVYDACTGTTGLLPDALAGLRHLLASNHDVELNHVVSSLNAEDLTHSVERLATLFPHPPRPRLHFSVMGIPEHRDVTHLHVAYDALVQGLDGAMDRAEELGVPCAAALSASHACVPSCVLARSRRLSRDSTPTHEHDPNGTRSARWWTKPDVCARCREREACMGLPRSYVERFETQALKVLSDETES